MRKKAFISTLLASMLCAGMAAGAAEYTPGVTVEKDEASATGYTATFVYEDAQAQQVQLRGAFMFYYDEEDVRGAAPEKGYTPEEWQDGMFEAGDEALTVDMEKVEGTDLWVTSLPLPNGHYQYVFLTDGVSDVKLEDPTNPMEASGVENGNHYDRSTFYVPYDEEKQANSLNWSFMAPREDEQVGTVTYMNYTDINGDPAPLGVYLPYGYSEDGDPYKVFFVSHGGGGNETDWFAGGSLDYIFDNMIAEGTTEPVVLVCMNNSAYHWQFDVIVDNLMNCVVPYVEENFNVSKEQKDHAFAGLSMGGVTSTNVLLYAADYFGYIDIMSGAYTAFDPATIDWESMKDTKVVLGAGIYDFGLTGGLPGNSFGFSTLDELSPILEEHNIPYTLETAYGSHDWNTWPQLMKNFAEEYLWK